MVPPISAVYDAGKIQKWRGWFSSTSKASGGRALVTKAHRKLLSKYRAMKKAVRQLGANASIAQVRSVVEQHFPNGLYELMVQQAKTESQAAQFKLEDAVRKGKWIW